MARPAKGSRVDPKQRVLLTNRIVDEFSCADGKDQTFLRDTGAPGLRVRAVASGGKSYVFERKYLGGTVRRTIGDVRAVTLDDARKTARDAYSAYDQGVDFFGERELAALRYAEQKDIGLTKARVAWDIYVKERAIDWSERHKRDHEEVAREGGGIRNRAPVVNGVKARLQEGILFFLLEKPLIEWTPETFITWAEMNVEARRCRLRLATRLVNTFMTWCHEHPDYKGLLLELKYLTRSKRMRAILGSPGTKSDSILLEGLHDFFHVTRRYANACMSAYLQVMLLTGGRPNEILGIKWDDVNFERKHMRLKDKVKGYRYIPLTPYVENLLADLPKISEYIFSSPRSRNGRMGVPTKAFTLLCQKANIDHCTLHGLRRTFATITDWMDDLVPSGVVAQIMGHAPSATAEKHYKVRPIDMLRKYHIRIERYLLVAAGLDPDLWYYPNKLSAERKAFLAHQREASVIAEVEEDDDATVPDDDGLDDVLIKLREDGPMVVYEAGDGPGDAPVPEVPSAEQIFLLTHAAPLVAEPLPAPVVVDPDVDHELFYGTPPAEQGQQDQGSLF